MALVSYALTSVANAQTYLGITGDTTLLELLIDGATDYIESQCGRRFASTTYTQEEYDGTESNYIFLKQYPVTAATTIERNDGTLSTPSWTSLTEGDDYEPYLNEGYLDMLGRTSETERHRYRATYTAGYTTIPYDLEIACLKLVSEGYNKRKNDGVTSERIGSWAITYGSVIENDKAFAETIARYRRI